MRRNAPWTRRRTLAFIAWSALFGAPNAGARPALAQDGFVLFSASSQTNPAVAYDEDRDQWLVVGLEGDLAELSARTLTWDESGGEQLGKLQRIEPNTRGHLSGLDVAFGPDEGLYLATWFRVSTVLGAFLDPDGRPTGDPFDTFQHGGRPLRLLYDPEAGRWLMAWVFSGVVLEASWIDREGTVERVSLQQLKKGDFHLDDLDLDRGVGDGSRWFAWNRGGTVRAQRLDLGSGEAGPRRRLAGGDRNRGVAMRQGAEGRALAVWEREQKIRGRFIAGDRLEPGFFISDRENEAFVPAVGYNLDANLFLAVWTEWAESADIRARWVDPKAIGASASFEVAGGSTKQMTLDHNNVTCSTHVPVCLVTWAAGPAGEPVREIRGRFVKAP